MMCFTLGTVQNQPSLVENPVFPMILRLLVGYLFVNIVLQNEGRERLLTVPQFQS